MGLSRLENFLKNVRGNILYVSPNDLDATDSVDNKGNSLTRPFKTIQRALIESARFSYQQGLDNDRFGNTTILLYPGEHIVDNRPGWIPIPDGATAKFQKRDGSESTDFPAWDLDTVYDLNNSNNALYKLNSIHGGVILPRGTSLVGLDLRKTKIRPKYVPNPTNDTIERTALFRVTGACYLWQFTMFDADPNGVCYVDYTENTFVPNFSHHKLTCFEYADGVNAKFRLRDGTTSSDFPAWDLTTTYDLNNSDNALYKLNSVHGGVIMPRGTSLVGLDLRKTKIRPKYVPSPTNATIDRTALFRVTGACYFWQFTIFDADPNGTAYLDYTANQFVPNFSHNKLTCFEYADGVNPVKINDSYNTYSSDRTDLQMYYEKVGLAYGTASGREIQPDYPSSSIDIQPKIDEYRIVGSTGKSVGISSLSLIHISEPTRPY